MQEDLSWPPWIQHTTHLSNLLLVVSTATSFYIYLLKHHARTETELPRPQHLYLAGHHQHSYRIEWLLFVLQRFKRRFAKVLP